MDPRRRPLASSHPLIRLFLIRFPLLVFTLNYLLLL